MARRGRKGALEWVTDTFLDATVDRSTQSNTLQVIDLDLEPGWVAEIRKVESYLECQHEAEADSSALMAVGLGIDPSTNIGAGVGGTTAANWDDIEDEELFFVHRMHLSIVSVTAASTFGNGKFGEHYSQDYPDNPPLVVPRNLGWSISVFESASTGVTNEFQAFMRVWYKRRKAPDSELAILLNRR